MLASFAQAHVRRGRVAMSLQSGSRHRAAGAGRPPAARDLVVRLARQPGRRQRRRLPQLLGRRPRHGGGAPSTPRASATPASLGASPITSRDTSRIHGWKSGRRARRRRRRRPVPAGGGGCESTASANCSTSAGCSTASRCRPGAGRRWWPTPTVPPSSPSTRLPRRRPGTGRARPGHVRRHHRPRPA